MALKHTFPKIPMRTMLIIFGVIIPWYILTSCQSSVNEYETRPALSFSQVKEFGLAGCLDYYAVPGCAWAVIDDQGVTTGTLGETFIGSGNPIKATHRFQIGSLGKSYTSLMAAQCVEAGLINWDTKILTVFPTWQEHMHSAYKDITLADLLSHNHSLQPLNAHQTQIDEAGNLIYEDIPNFYGSDSERRRDFSKYALSLVPVETEGVNYGNAGYIIAGCMLEEVTGKTWEILAQELASDLEIEIGFERPNRIGPSQPWGHRLITNKRLQPVAASEREIYNDPLSSPAGNINVNILDFSKYVRQFMNGLHTVDGIVKAETFKYLLMGRNPYAMGWYNDFTTDSIFYHYGSEGTFYCHMMIFANLNAAIIIFTNANNEDTTVNFINDIRNYLKYTYIYGSDS
ncbi:CubicO group peptidase, beta-lactamase class C family [Sphaerochaeta associata]|uniref:Beta-lactamase family protein n=1 Tax=Sphaerochaeta associata TaxID=1129264 RepID=A0ABY4DFQ7_9SPIR|nr:serine hydrolase domain-containing protein [Sphaerochaeta associata]UOM51954.1 beta-lactamase family protein [Sphaerochaeta associata]SMP58239.1 CubicO group peptidase, beta-lactamase class C family [Sphaerochaeta associata]